MKVQVKFYNIFIAEGEIYFYLGDQNLYKATGEYNHIIELILESLKQGNDVATTIENTCKKDSSLDQETVTQVIDWLYQNRIIELRQSNESSTESNLRVAIVGYFNRELEEVTSFLHELNSETVSINNYQIIDLSNEGSDIEIVGCDIMICLSPFLVEREKIKEISAISVENQIPIFHVGINSNSITIGPILSSQKDMPCLYCYYLRKLQNLQNLKGNIEFIKMTNKVSLSSNNILKNKHIGIIKELLKIELEKWIKTSFSALLGKSTIINTADYTTQNSLILKSPFCEVCSNHSVINLFD